MIVFILSLITFISIIFQFLFICFFVLWLFFLLLRKLQNDKSIIHPTTLKIESFLLKLDVVFFNLKTWQHIILFILMPSSWIIVFVYCSLLKSRHQKKPYINLKITNYLRHNKKIKLQFGVLKNNLYRRLKKTNSYNNVKLYKNNKYCYIAKKYYEHKKQINYNSIEYIDILSGIEFEKYMSKLLPKLGYKNVKLTPASNDYGIDLIAEKDDVKFAIQCKHYKGKVSNSSIQEANSGKQYYHCHVGVVVTNSYFTYNAKELAKNNGIILWDRKKLIEMLKDV